LFLQHHTTHVQPTNPADYLADVLAADDSEMVIDDDEEEEDAVAATTNAATAESTTAATTARTLFIRSFYTSILFCSLV